jgi:hypothetical protein
MIYVWALGIPLGVLVATGVIKTFYDMFLNIGEKEGK